VKKILIVCMLNSIHTATWLSRFKDQEIEFTLFPSTNFHFLHSEIEALLNGSNVANYKIKRGLPSTRFTQYLEYLISKFDFFPFNIFSRTNRLKRVIKYGNFEIIHALELQGAGYLLLENAKVIGSRIDNVYLTNWGSDIYFFQKFDDDSKKINSLMEMASHYSAECIRDYELARRFGFKGEELPLVPNSTAFSRSDLSKQQSSASTRNRIVVKTYGSTFGLGSLAIESVRDILQSFPKIRVTFYSVTEDLLSLVQQLKSKHPDHIEYFTVRNPLSHEVLMQKFREARVYLGCSRSDGISTSFLEALASGCYPIQTDTSCAGEWVDLGAIASVIPTTKEAAVDALKLALADDELVNRAQKANLKIAQTYLSQEYIKKQLEHFYD